MSSNKTTSGVAVNRRAALGLAAASATVAVTQSGAAQAAAASPGNHAGAAAISTPAGTVATTKYGKVRGYVRNGISTFKGIPYGADTGGANRWLPAKAPESWQGELSCLTYGPVCPHPVRGDWGRSEAQFVYDWDDGFEREDMLRVNVWSSALTGKKPVVVWIHGGGMTSGSCQELPSYDGENMAKKGVVFVSLNHRLNALGFMDLSQIGGAAYKESGNVGLTDLVFALQWVRDNIAAFGGDPARVTIMGQSGGGSKVTCLMAMPSAKGLFHRAVVESGGGGNYPDSALQQRYAAAIMTELGLAANDIAGLQKVPHQRLLAAGQAASQKVNPPVAPPGAGGPVLGGAAAPRAGFGPTFDGSVFTERAWGTSAPAVSSDVPLMIGSVREETFTVLPPLSEAQVANDFNTMFPGKGAQVHATMKAAFPNTPPTVLKQTVSGLRTRGNMLRLADLKANAGGAPVYQFWFTWQPVTVLEGRSGAFHCLDIAFFFDNTARCEQATGNTPAAKALAAKMSTAIVNFAATGNPSQPGLAWAPYTAASKATMLWDNTSRVENGPFEAVRAAITA